MLNERQINLLPERIVERLRQANTEYLENIGHVIKKIGELRPTDVHQLQQMYNYGADLQKVTLKLAEVSKKNVQDIYDMFDIVAMENYNYAKPFYDAKAIPHIPYAQNEDLKNYVKSLAKQTVDEYVNLTQHTAFAIFDKDGKSIAPLFANNKDKIATSLSDTYTKVIDYAVSKVQLGEESYQSAMRKVIKSLANSGIKTVEYATGYKRRLDSAVRQNILWGVKQCNQNVADYVGEQFGADGYEISYHSNPRPEHADMGGKSYAIGKARIVNGIYYPSFSEVEKLLEDYGCLHFKFPILLGISRPTYDKEQLDELKANDNAKFEFEGKEYTKYEGEQIQKKIESAVKHKKDLANIAKASGDEDLRREIQYEINLLTSKYAKLSEVSGLPTRIERMQVAGFRKVLTHAELWTSQIKGVVASNGIIISSVSKHVYDQAKLRKLLPVMTKENMTETLTNPLKIGKIKIDDKGRKSQQFIGDVITLAANPDTGVITTLWKTSSKKVAKLKKGAP